MDKKREKIIFLTGGLIFALILVFVLSKEIDRESKVCFDDECFFVEVADTISSREKGLMFRESLDKDSGMLFIFESSGNYPFWMKNTLIPLDIIWISESMDVIDIKSATPCGADPCEIINHLGIAKYVLEVNSKLVVEYGINIGDKVKFTGGL